MQLPLTPVRLWFQHPSTRDILWLFLLTRLLLVFVTYFGYIFLTQGQYSYLPTSMGTLLATWKQGDVNIYLSIAQHGYTSPTELAFFPLYPLLLSALTYLSEGSNYLLVGMLLSNLALLGALYILYQLVEELEDGQAARRTLLYLCIFPTTLFFFAAYNESLFLLLSSGTLLALRRQRWWLAGLLGLLGALTQAAGLLLSVVFLYELWIKRSQIMSSVRTCLLALTPLALIPLGMVLYCFYCWKLTGNPIAFATMPGQSSQQMIWTWQGILQNLLELAWKQPFGSFHQVHAFLNLATIFGSITLVILGRKLLPISFTLWGSLLLFSILLAPCIQQQDGLISHQRFVLEVFPMFMTLALLGQRHPRLHQILVWTFPALLAMLSLSFLMGRWIV